MRAFAAFTVTIAAAAGLSQLPVHASAKQTAAAAPTRPHPNRGLHVGALLHAPHLKRHVKKYTWLRCERTGPRCQIDAQGRHRTRYRLRLVDAGHRVVLSMVVGDPDSPVGQTTVTTVPTVVIVGPTPVNAQLPTITGTAQEGQVLTGALGTWSNAQYFSYQWQDCDANGNNCVAISGASGTTTDVNFQPTYTLQASDVGETICLQVTAYDYPESQSALSGPPA